MKFNILIALFIASFAALALGQTAPVSPGETAVKTVEQPEMAVVGVSVTTTNQAEMGAGGQIPKLWTRFMQENLETKIADRADGNLVVVYTDYASDQTGAFTYLIGARVKPKMDASEKLAVPDGMVLVHVPAGRYALIPSAQGSVYKVVPEVWQRIWALTPEQLGGKRAFRADYEVYKSGFDPANGQVDVYIGVK